jgi:hypothetical protein
MTKDEKDVLALEFVIGWIAVGIGLVGLLGWWALPLAFGCGVLFSVAMATIGG